MRKRPEGLINGAIFDSAHRDELRNKAWETDQHDRDNWFDAHSLTQNPRHLDFGNGAPIVAPNNDLYEIRLEVRELVRFARKIVTKHFSSLEQVKACFEMFLSSRNEEILKLPKSHFCVAYYSLALVDLERSVRSDRDPELRLLDLAKAASRLTRLAQMDQDQIDTREHRKSILAEMGRELANRKHSKPGASRDKRAQIQAIWRSGKFTTKDLCAEQEYQALGMSLSTARKALRGI